jgi:hypothetical protein
MEKEKATLEQMFEKAQNALENGDTALFVPTMSSLQGGVSRLSRSNTTEVWVIEFGQDVSELQVAHLGDVHTRVTRYTDASRVWDENATDLVIFEGVSIAVLDHKNNNDDWDKYGHLSNAEKRQVLTDLGAQFFANSTRGNHGFDDVKRKYAKIAP